MGSSTGCQRKSPAVLRMTAQALAAGQLGMAQLAEAGRVGGAWWPPRPAVPYPGTTWRRSSRAHTTDLGPDP